MMHFLGGLALLALPVTVVASPVANYPDPKAINSKECAAIGFIVNTLKAYPSATPFCSSYLVIPTITSTITQTSTSVVPTLSTKFTSTSTSTFTSTVTNTISTAITTCTAVTTSVAPVKVREELEHRGAENKPCTTTSKSTSTSFKATSTPYATTTGKPKPVPTLPSCVTSFESAAISTACSCLAIPTPISTATTTLVTTSTSTSVTSQVSTASTTVTTTISTTATSISNYCPVATSCSNQGLQWAAYNNTSGSDYGGSDKYPSFLPEDYKTQSPLYTSTTNTVGLNVTDSGTIISIYGSPAEFQSEFFIINHRGYLLAEQTGTYTFSATSVDDTISLWLGPIAYTGWTRSNDNLDASYDNGPAEKTITYSLTAGQYLPIRIFFAQAQGAATFELSVTAPDGSSGANFVQYTCDGTTAPAYKEAFGAET